MSNVQLENYIDHTCLKADASIDDINKLCAEALEHNFYAICINSSYVSHVQSILLNTNIKVAATIGFPLGSANTQAKVAEAVQAVQDGCHEIDMVINIGFLKSGMYQEVMKDMQAVKKAVGKKIIVKAIFENCLLTNEETITACQLAIQASVDYVKTSTGFITGSKEPLGATKKDLELMIAEVADDNIKVKAAGGIKDYKTAIKFIKMGVSRIGTSAGVTIISGQPNKTEY